MSVTPYPQQKASGVDWLGAVPAHWDVCALNYRFEIDLGKMLDEKRITGDHLGPYLRNTDVQWGRVNIEDLPVMDFSGADLTRYALLKGDLLVCEGGEIGRAAVWEGHLSPCFYQKALHRLRPRRPERDCPRFTLYLFSTAAKLGVFAGGEGRSTIAHLPAECLRRYRMCFPPPHEQIAIATFLDRETGKIDALVEDQGRLIALLKEKRQAVISHAVTKGLNPNAPMKDSGIEWLGEVPAHWGVQPLKYFVTLKSGGTPSKNREDYWTGEIPWASAKDLKADRLYDTIDHLTDKAIAEGAASLNAPGSVLVLVRGMMLARAFPVVRIEVPMAINQDLKALTPIDDLDVDFLSWLLRATAQESMDRCDEAGHGTKALRMEAWLSMSLPRPPLPEQLHIVGHLDRTTGQLDKLVNQAEASIALLAERRAALISAAVTGKIDVRDMASNLLEVA